jgi:L-ascorbate metabolism protein UlaG (beta-lactamase superfamily)
VSGADNTPAPPASTVWGDGGWDAPGPAEVARARLTWLGHSTVVIELAGMRILTDPVIRRRVAHLRRASEVPSAALEGADLVLVSHVHWDHLDLPSLQHVGRDAPVVVPAGAGRLIARQGFHDVVEVQAGDVVGLGGLSIMVTHAEHAASRGPLGVHAASVGYLVERPRRIYFAGDTDLFAGMRELAPGLEVALLPISGWGPRVPPGHLDAERAARALELLRPGIAIPVHWGTYRPMHRREAPVEPADEFVRLAARLAPDVDVRVLPVGGSCAI